MQLIAGPAFLVWTARPLRNGGSGRGRIVSDNGRSVLSA
jgi:hypothetical protein